MVLIGSNRNMTSRIPRHDDQPIRNNCTTCIPIDPYIYTVDGADVPELGFECWCPISGHGVKTSEKPLLQYKYCNLESGYSVRRSTDDSNTQL